MTSVVKRHEIAVTDLQRTTNQDIDLGCSTFEHGIKPTRGNVGARIQAGASASSAVVQGDNHTNFEKDYNGNPET